MSKLIWLGFDLIFRPLRSKDFAAVVAGVPAAPAPNAGKRNGEAS